MRKSALRSIVVVVLLSIVISGCMSNEPVFIYATMDAMQEQLSGLVTPEPDDSGAPDESPVSSETEADVSITLTTGSDGNELVFIGVGGDIDGVINPQISVEVGDTVSITLVNGVAVEHDLRIDEFEAETGSVTAEGEEATVIFVADQAGSFFYFCTIPGHRLAGMEGILVVGDPAIAEETNSITRAPTDLPGPVGNRSPGLVQVELVAEEVVGQLADNATYSYFTFGGEVPGPFIRAREGDTVEITLTNNIDSTFIHSVDLHAVNGPGGGAVYTQTNPGETNVFTFTALNPGVYIYHCATPSVAHHIANGMYGLIVVEPEGGLPAVDREFYVVQSEMYTAEPFGTAGHLTFSHEKMLDETPEYFVFNGAAGALASDEFALRAEVGETVRIFFGVAGPNFTSSFHVIGEIFDKVYPFGSFTSEPFYDVQTINVNPGAAWAVEFTIQEPGEYILVDHALSRLERGLVGLLIVDGDPNLDIYREGPANQ